MWVHMYMGIYVQAPECLSASILYLSFFMLTLCPSVSLSPSLVRARTLFPSLFLFHFVSLSNTHYGVALVIRFDSIIVLFCNRAP